MFSLKFNNLLHICVYVPDETYPSLIKFDATRESASFLVPDDQGTEVLFRIEFRTYDRFALA